MRYFATLFRRSISIIRFPQAEWGAVQAESPHWSAVVLGHVLPLSLLPAFGWATGLALTNALPHPGQGLGAAFAMSATLTVVLSVLCVLLLAGAFYVLAPMHDMQRHWNRAVSVAGYGTTPVLIAGALLIMPIMVMGSMVAMLHCFALYYAGVQRVSGCKQSAAAEYVAVSSFLAAVAMGAVGALGGALGVL